MRLSINLSEDLVKQIDEKAKALYISRSAFIATALSQKLQNDKLMENVPEMIQTMKSAVELEKKRTEDCLLLKDGDGGKA